MRIAFLSPSAQVGGAETCLLDVLASLRQAAPQWRMTVIAAADGPLVESVRALGVSVAVLPFPASIARLGESGSVESGGAARFAGRLGVAVGPIASYTAALRRTLADVEADIVHTNGFKMHLLGAYASQAPVVWHVHDYITSRRVAKHLLRWNASRCSAIVANSDSVAADARAALGPGVPITRIYNGVDLSRFSPVGASLDLDGLAGLPRARAGTVRVGLLATFALWKGHETFLRAVAAVPDDVPVRAYVIGGAVYQTDGSQYRIDQLRALADRIGVADRVAFTGPVDRADAALRSLDIVVHASTSPEPFGLVIAEAMACGRAVVVSGAGGAAELVTPDVDAVTHSPGDAASLAAAIRSLAANAGRRAALGRAARLTAERRFDRARLAAELVPVYQRVANFHAQSPVRASAEH